MRMVIRTILGTLIILVPLSIAGGLAYIAALGIWWPAVTALVLMMLVFGYGIGKKL